MTPFTTDLSILSALDLSAFGYSEPFRVMLLSAALFILSSVIRRRPWTTAARQTARRLTTAARVALNISQPSTSGNLAS